MPYRWQSSGFAPFALVAAGVGAVVATLLVWAIDSWLSEAGLQAAGARAADHVDLVVQSHLRPSDFDACLEPNPTDRPSVDEIAGALAVSVGSPKYTDTL